ncbi:peptidase S9 [Pseudoxanthomonas sp. Root65]|nr:peptidase S9 [Pseudoxanthomonas sp. Root65]
MDVDAFVRKDQFVDIKLSPNGEYFAATVPLEDSTALAITSRQGNKLLATFGMGKNTHVDGFWWVSPDRVVIAMAEKYGSLDEPIPTGELYAIGAEGGKPTILVGYRIGTQQVGSNIQQKKAERVSAYLIDSLSADTKNVLVAIWPWGEEPYTRVERMDVFTGRRVPVARAPVRRAHFTTDNAGAVRFARGRGIDNISKLYHRSGEGAEWVLVNDEATTHRVEVPLGFAEDNRTAYLQVEQAQGTDILVAYDTTNGERREVFRNVNVDPDGVIYANGVRDFPVGLFLSDGRSSTTFFDAGAPEARLYRSLEGAFPGQAVVITSSTDDGKEVLVNVSSDRNPGEFYLFDTQAKKADFLLARRQWFDPANMAEQRPVRLKARDGVDLHGYLTLPRAGGKAPMIVLPHGGPFGVRDYWGFERETQMLAQAGYTVLQVNYRGSGGYGRRFRQAGAREAGGKMQDDVTDATRWAIAEGHADPSRICIYGASYGAYAALVGVAKEPGLYKCAAGYVGLYDLPMMFQRGDVQETRSGETFLREWYGDKSALSAVSPTNMADRIKSPVFLAAGGEDERTPVEHTELMERRLKAAGVPVESLYYKTEGHGFYKPEHQKEYYTRLLAFFSKHLGGATAK